METWDNVDLVQCNPQSLLGYGKEAHKASGGVCLYCGMGSQQAAPEEIVFDMWRQLSVEHIIPDEVMSVGRVCEGIARAFPKLPSNEKKNLEDCIRGRLNLITACHFCNSAVSHHKKKPRVQKVVEEFCNYLCSGANAGRTEVATLRSDVVSRWLRGLAGIIEEAYRQKAAIARGKVMGLRTRYRCALQRPLPRECACESPETLNSRFAAALAAHISDLIGQGRQ